jgi:hypothetical protein
VLKESFPYVARRDANNGIFASVIVWSTAKDFDAENSFLQVFLPSGNGLFDDVFKELAAAATPTEGFPLEDFLQMALNTFAGIGKLYRKDRLFGHIT